MKTAHKILKIFLLAHGGALVFSGIDAGLGANHWPSKLHLWPLDYSLNFCLSLVLLGTAGLGPRPIRACGTCLLAAALFLYAAGWSCYFIMGEFPTIEALRFFIYNFSQVLCHLAQTSPLAIFLLFFFAFSMPFAACSMAAFSARFLTAPAKGPLFKTALFASGLSLLWSLFLLNNPIQSPSASIVAGGLSPQATLISASFLSTPKARSAGAHNGLVRHWDKQLPPGEFRRQAGRIAAGTPVILIVVESLRNDVLGDGRIMPNLYKLKQKSLYFSNAVPPSDETDYAWPAILSSQYPLRSSRHYYYPKQPLYPRVFIYDLLKGFGYATAVFSAQNETWGRMRNYLDTGGIDKFFDSTSPSGGQYASPFDSGFLDWTAKIQTAGKIDDGVVMDNALKWMSQISRPDFFIAFNLQRPHFPYTWPDSYRPKFSPHKIDFKADFTDYPRSKVPVMKNRYYNALSYTDLQIGRLIAFLKDRGLYDQSLIVVTGDHGEAFFEKGVACHANDLLYEQTHTSIILKAPHNSRNAEIKDIVETIDVAPMICRVLGIKPHPAFQGVDVLSPLQLDRRPVFMTVSTLRAIQDAVILQNWKFVRDYKYGKDLLFKIDADPLEEKNVIAEHPRAAEALRGRLLDWRSVQLNYYEDPVKQKDYYAPKFMSKLTGALEK